MEFRFEYKAAVRCDAVYVYVSELHSDDDNTEERKYSFLPFYSSFRTLDLFRRRTFEY